MENESGYRVYSSVSIPPTAVTKRSHTASDGVGWSGFFFVLGVAAMIGGGTWGAMRVVQPDAPHVHTVAAPAQAPDLPKIAEPAAAPPVEAPAVLVITPADVPAAAPSAAPAKITPKAKPRTRRAPKPAVSVEASPEPAPVAAPPNPYDGPVEAR